MKLVLGVDLETTGLEAESCSIIEIGAVLWDIDNKKMVDQMSRFISYDKDIPEEITKITGITTSDVKNFGIPLDSAIDELLTMSRHASHFVAHNAPFDRGFLLEKTSGSIKDILLNKPWIDTKIDLPYPDGLGKGTLTLIAANHGFLNPFAHRALFDTLTMMRVFANYDWKDILGRTSSPTLEIIAHVSYNDREKAKNAGFYWDGDRKVWHRRLKECDVHKHTWDFCTTVTKVDV